MPKQAQNARGQRPSGSPAEAAKRLGEKARRMRGSANAQRARDKAAQDTRAK